MAHFTRKIQITNPKNLAKSLLAQDAILLYESKETDIYQQITPNYFQRLRLYNPAIEFDIDPDTGETKAPNSCSGAKKIKTSAVFVLSNSVQNELSTDFNRVVVLNVWNDKQAKEIQRVMKESSIDQVVVQKERQAFWLEWDHVSFLIHLDHSVQTNTGDKLGSFIEFELKQQESSILSHDQAKEYLDKITALFALKKEQYVRKSYYQMVSK